MDVTELLGHATRFVFVPSGADRSDPDTRHFRVQVEWCGGDAWAVRWMDECWNGSEWEWEASSSNREGDFLARCRFTLEEACAHARALPNTVKPNGATYAQWQSSRAKARPAGQ